MEIISILGIVLFAAAVLIFFKITKAVAKTIMFALTLLFIIGVVFGFLLLSDIKDIRKNFAEKPNMFLLQKEGSIIAGFVSTPANDIESMPESISSAQINRINSDYAAGKFDSIIGDNYKFFVVDESVFEGVDFKSSDGLLTKVDILRLMSSSSPIDDYVGMQAPETATSEQKSAMKSEMMSEAPFSDDTGFKSFLFGMMMAGAMETEGPAFLFEQQKQGKVTVYPETITFKALKSVPSFILNNFITTSGE